MPWTPFLLTSGILSLQLLLSLLKLNEIRPIICLTDGFLQYSGYLMYKPIFYSTRIIGELMKAESTGILLVTEFLLNRNSGVFLTYSLGKCSKCKRQNEHTSNLRTGPGYMFCVDIITCRNPDRSIDWQDLQVTSKFIQTSPCQCIWLFILQHPGLLIMMNTHLLYSLLHSLQFESTK